MNTEAFVIEALSKKSALIGDDAAVIHNLLFSSDAFFENVHFKREWMSYYQIGYKAMIVNISDAIAMNAKPKYALLTVALPKDISKSEVSSLLKGLQDAASLYKCNIIGGDTIANDKLDISLTIISKSKNILYRKKVKEGDILAFTGSLGGVKKDLKKLFRGGKCSNHSRFIKPILRQNFIHKSFRFLHSGMDISDGLFEDSKKLTSTINCHFRLFKHIPKDIACSGEEYEMLISFPLKNFKAIKRVSEKTRTPLTLFAKVCRCKKRFYCKSNHF